MPYYIYECKKHGNFEHFSSVNTMKMKRKCPKCRLMGRRNIVAEQRATSSIAKPSCWPLISDAFAVNPNQIRKQQAALAAKGVQCDFTPEGQAIFTSRKHRKMVCEAGGLFDRNGGYSDPRRTGANDDTGTAIYDPDDHDE